MEDLQKKILKLGMLLVEVILQKFLISSILLRKAK